MKSKIVPLTFNKLTLHCTIIYISLLCSLLTEVDAQHKPPLNDSSYKYWPEAVYTATAISDDGDYIWYTVRNVPAGNSTLIIQSTKGDWKFESQKFRTATLLNTDNESLAILSGADSLEIIKLGTSNRKIFPGKEPVIGYIPARQQEIARWVMYKENNSQSVKVLNLETGKETIYNQITEYSALVTPNKFRVTLSIGDTKKIGILNLANNIIDTIATIPTKGFANIETVYSDLNKKYYFRVAYRLHESIDRTDIYSYDLKSGTSKLLVDDKILAKVDSTCSISQYLWGLTSNDNILYFFSDRSTRIKNPNRAGKSGIIWKYTDKYLKPNTDNGYLVTKNLLSSLNLKTNKIKIIESENTSLISDRETTKPAIAGDRAVVYTYPNIRYLNNFLRYKDSIKAVAISLYDGMQEDLGFTYQAYQAFQSLSPNGLYVISSNANGDRFILHNLKENKKLTINIPFKSGYNDPDVDPYDLPKVAGWSPSGDTAFIYGEYDIWMVTKDNTGSPVNLTNGFGDKMHTQFRFQKKDGIIRLSSDTTLSALNKKNKNNGFYTLSRERNQDPRELSMGPYYYYFSNMKGELARLASAEETYTIPTKAKFANAYILGRSSANKTRNIFLSKDLKTFTQITQLTPESDYNWLTSELINWEVKPGINKQGILYKPEDFDSTRKYPVIFYIYDQFSNGLNASLVPRSLNSYCNLNIPYYVSNGFLVFCPDAYTPSGDPLLGGVKNIRQSIQALTKKVYIDTSKLGIDGCSWGGIQTNFIITQIKEFAAACSASGMANLISVTNDHYAISYGPLYPFFSGAMRFGKELYGDKDAYIRNSAILYGDKVQTPLLLMHTDKDGICPLQDIIQYYSALRNEQKPVWLLEYTDGTHGVLGESGLDFSKKMSQFFNHFLKNQKMPDWMLP